MLELIIPNCDKSEVISDSRNVFVVFKDQIQHNVNIPSENVKINNSNTLMYGILENNVTTEENVHIGTNDAIVIDRVNVNSGNGFKINNKVLINEGSVSELEKRM